ncbi:cytochrome P450 [Polychaeton citri CBS 116435]|uniref:Cytochrome P450 n=1 Tax=Polychaeton citri CBS 116435 TaxID=1314669 RepID=A0A9P4Q5W5_9PEZI|nr:cytochrome P450 [Polychaeton citri CBS 116435]
MTADGLPSFPFARENGYHPPSLNAKLRHECPISKVKLYDGNQAWILTKHKHCCEALVSDRLSADRRAHGYPEIHESGKKARDAKPMFVNLDNPEHDQQRAMLEPEFTAEAVEQKWRPRMEKTIDRLLDRFIEKGRNHQPIDLVKELATPLPTHIIYEALGVPQKDVEYLSNDSEVRNSTSRNAAESANTHLHEYMADLVKAKIKEPGDDIISRLVENYQKGNLTEDEVVTLAFLVLTAGNAALISSIGVGVLILLEHPDQLQEFKQKPELASKVVIEITRYHVASALNSRRAVMKDTEIGGQKLRAGESVICSVQAGNRDEDKFGRDAESFNIHRDVEFGDSLGFGYGPHRCQADKFSRAQLEIALTKLFQRLPHLRLAKTASELSYTPATMNAAVTELPVYFE